MTAEVSDVLKQLAVIQAEIIDPLTGIAIVSYENVPYTISTADMPLFVNFVGALTQNQLVGSDEAAREYNEVRTFNMVLYHSPKGAGVEGEKMGLLTPYFALVYAQFGKYPHLKNLAGTLDSKIAADSGMSVVPFVGQEYYGIRFSLQVTSKARRVLASGE